MLPDNPKISVQYLDYMLKQALGPKFRNTHLWNVGLLQREYTVLRVYPRRLESPYSSPWEPEVLVEICISIEVQNCLLGWTAV
jgi:hypothetical protein